MTADRRSSVDKDRDRYRSSTREARDERRSGSRRVREPQERSPSYKYIRVRCRRDYSDDRQSTSPREGSRERRNRQRIVQRDDSEELEDNDRRSSQPSRRRTSNFVAGAKLGTFDGSTNLETFLAKLDRCVSYFGWDEQDELFQLTTALQGAAGQVLWDLGKNVTARSLRKLLRVRFGEGNQAERFRAELRGRRRGQGESLQNLYTDICRLMALAYPGPTSTLSDIVGRDAFLDALNNNKLRIRILETEPATLSDALRTAMRLEAYEGGRKVEVDEPQWKNRRAAQACAQAAGASSAESGTDDGLEALRVQVASLEDRLRAVASEQRPPAEQPLSGSVSQGKGKKARKLAGEVAPVQAPPAAAVTCRPAACMPAVMPSVGPWMTPSQPVSSQMS